MDPVTVRAFRRGIALLVAFDAVQLAIRTWLTAMDMREAPSLQVAPLAELIARTPGAPVALAFVSVWAMTRFARGVEPVVMGLTALVANRLILEAYGSLRGVFDESFYHTGATLMGWLIGWGVARRAKPRPLDEDASLALASLGAAAVFGATYLNAGTSKLLDSGLSWASTDAIRLAIVAERHSGELVWTDPIKDFFLVHPRLCMGLEVATLVVQLGAFVYPWNAWTRALWGAAFIGFHLGIHLLTGILFPEPAMIAILLGVPWGKLTAEGRRAAPIAIAYDAVKGPLRQLRLVVVAVVVVSLFVPSRPHPIEQGVPPIQRGVVPVVTP